MTRLFLLALCFLALISLSLSHARAEDYILTIKDHHFAPVEITIPAHQKIKLTVKNLDATVEEFESSDLNREKIVGGNSEIIVFIGPLEPGRYGYFGDFHRDLATGTIIVK